MDAMLPVQVLEVLEGLGETVWQRELDTDKVWATSGVWTALGYPKGSVPRTNAQAVRYFHPQDAVKWKNGIADYLRSGRRSFRLVIRVRDAKASWRSLCFKGCVVARNEAGEPLTIGGIISDVTEELAEKRSQAKARATLSSLSVRERQVLNELMTGATNKQIAFSLDLSPRTVEFYRARMLEKLGVKSVPALASLCTQAGYADAISRGIKESGKDRRAGIDSSLLAAAKAETAWPAQRPAPAMALASGLALSPSDVVARPLHISRAPAKSPGGAV